ncbi:MAG: DUF2306 domain-containing protein [Rhodospirillales bacterium]
MAAIWIHLVLAVIALGLGTANLVREKGTPVHRLLGWIWVISMAIVAISTYWIRGLGDGSFSPIHILSVWTIVSMAIALVSIRRGRVQTHARFMTGTMVGAAIAAILALAPGRLLSHLLGYAG